MNNSISQLTGVRLNGFGRPRPDSTAAEAKLAGLLRASPAGIGCLSDDLVTEANAQLCEMTGHAPEELIGFPFARLFADAREFDRVQTHLREQLAGKSVACLETNWLRSDGTVLEVRLTVTPLATGDGSREWIFMALGADHPGTKHLEARLLRAQRLESIGTLAGGLAHDLNNVLAPILMAVHLLK
jgi:PAS domain S-box-containing protein